MSKLPFADPPDQIVWVFDLDNTLYPATSNLFDQIDARIGAYIQRHLGLDPVAARNLQKKYFREHGTSLRGLMLHHNIEPHQYLNFVHDIDLAPIEPAPRLAAALARLPGRKLIFTNGSTGHARRVTDKLGVSAAIDDVFDIIDAEFAPKPEPATYRRFIDRFSVDPRRACMVEDLAHNLVPAAALGMVTALVGAPDPDAAAGASGVDHWVADLADWLDWCADALAAAIAPTIGQ